LRDEERHIDPARGNLILAQLCDGWLATKKYAKPKTLGTIASSQADLFLAQFQFGSSQDGCLDQLHSRRKADRSLFSRRRIFSERMERMFPGERTPTQDTNHPPADPKTLDKALRIIVRHLKRMIYSNDPDKLVALMLARSTNR